VKFSIPYLRCTSAFVSRALLERKTGAQHESVCIIYLCTILRKIKATYTRRYPSRNPQLCVSPAVSLLTICSFDCISCSVFWITLIIAPKEFTPSYDCRYIPSTRGPWCPRRMVAGVCRRAAECNQSVAGCRVKPPSRPITVTASIPEAEGSCQEVVPTSTYPESITRASRHQRDIPFLGPAWNQVHNEFIWQRDIHRGSFGTRAEQFSSLLLVLS